MADHRSYGIIEDTDANRREQCRFSPQTEKQKQVSLVAGRQKIACELINESTGGFMIALSRRAKIASGDQVELQLYNRSSPVRVLWSREEDGKQVMGLERKPEHIVATPEKSGGILLVALLLLTAFAAGYVLKKDEGMRQLLIRHKVMRAANAGK